MHTFHWLIIQGFLIPYVNGWYWGPWLAWTFGGCSKTCGTGVVSMTRKRHCFRERVKHWWQTSVGCRRVSDSQMSTAHCNVFLCPVDGGWASWTTKKREGLCSISCGFGKGSITMTYYRSCTNPEPNYGGKDCEGTSNKYTKVDCVATQPCTAVDAGWGEWNIKSTGPCSATCGSGTKQIVRKRICDNPPPKRGSVDCFGNPVQIITKTCDSKFKCKVHGGWSVWATTNATQCTVTCGSGFQHIYQRRLCNNPTPKNGGRMCVGIARESKMSVCKANSACVVDGGWGDYNIKDSEGECSVTCGSGTKQVSWTRICDNPKPSSGGKPCVGNSSVTASVDCKTGKSCEDLISNSDIVTPASPQESSETNTGVIAGSVVGVFIAVCLVAVGVFFFRMSKRKKSAEEKSNDIKIKCHRHVTTHHNPAFVPDKPNVVK